MLESNLVWSQARVSNYSSYMHFRNQKKTKKRRMANSVVQVIQNISLEQA